MLGHYGVVCVCVCRDLHHNDITVISLGAFEGLGSLTLLCAHQWCGENDVVWIFFIIGCSCVRMCV